MTPTQAVLHCTALHPRPLNNTPCCTGEAVPLHAGAHPPRPPRALHLEAACHRGELHADDQHPTARASAPAASPARNLSSRPTRLVPSSPHQQRRLTLLARLWTRRPERLLQRRLQLQRPKNLGRAAAARLASACCHCCRRPCVVAQSPSRFRLGLRSGNHPTTPLHALIR